MKIKSNLQALRYKISYKTLLYFNHNNPALEEYKDKGFKILSQKVDKLPEEIAFRPKLFRRSFCVKAFDKLYLFISKYNINKPEDERYDALFHEIGHWLHFQNMPPLAERKSIWKNANIEKVKKDVSEYAVKTRDGREFVAEVFKGLVKGKTFDNYIMGLYEKLKGPKLK